MKLITILLLSFLVNMVFSGNIIIGNRNTVTGTGNFINNGDSNDMIGNENTVI